MCAPRSQTLQRLRYTDSWKSVTLSGRQTGLRFGTMLHTAWSCFNSRENTAAAARVTTVRYQVYQVFMSIGTYTEHLFLPGPAAWPSPCAWKISSALWRRCQRHRGTVSCCCSHRPPRTAAPPWFSGPLEGLRKIFSIIFHPHPHHTITKPLTDVCQEKKKTSTNCQW